MKSFKIIFTILLFIIGTNVYSNELFYSSENHTIYKNLLLKSEKGEEYLTKFDNILDKYSGNAKVLVKLHNRILGLKTIIESNSNKYSSDIRNLIYYVDLSINFSLVELGVYIGDEDKELEYKVVEEEIKKTDVSYPGFDSNYIDNEKTVIAGDDFVVFSGKTSSLYESVDVGTVIFYIEGINASNLKYSLTKANLYLEGILIDDISSSNIDIVSTNKVSLTFDNLEKFIVPEKQVSFRLGIEANSIGYQKIGKTIKDLSITDVILSDSIGIKSGKKINAFSTTTSVEPFSIVPGVPIISVLSNLSNTPVVRFNIHGAFGDNTLDINNSTPSINLSKLKFYVIDNSSTAIFKLVNVDDIDDYIVGTKNGNILEFDLSSMDINNKSINEGRGENYEIYISNTSSLITLELLKDGILYDIDGINGATELNINMQSNINFGSRNF